MSDSGVLFCSNDIENLVVNEIERIKGSKQRADTISVCKALFKELRNYVRNYFIREATL